MKQRQYRKAEFFDGPPIHRCPVQEKLLIDAELGSRELKAAIEKAGLRP